MGQKLYDHNEDGSYTFKPGRKAWGVDIPAYAYDLWMPAIGLRPIGVYGLIWRLAREGMTKGMGLKKLATKAHMGDRAFLNDLILLDQLGWIKITVGNQRDSNQYEVLDIPTTLPSHLLSDDYEPLSTWLVEDVSSNEDAESSNEDTIIDPSNSLNVPKGTLRPASAGTQPPVITERSGGEDDPPDQKIVSYTAAERWVYHNQKGNKVLSASMRGRMNNPPSHLNDKGIVVEDDSVNKLFDTDKAYPLWCVEWVLPALKNTIGANQHHYKPSPSSLIDFMRNLNKFYEWKAKQPEARFKPLRKIISSV